MLESREEEEGVSRSEDSEVSGKVVHSTLPESACLPERRFPTAQRRGRNKRVKK